MSLARTATAMSADQPANVTARARLEGAAQQRGLTCVFSEASCSGPPHAPLYTMRVTCVVTNTSTLFREGTASTRRGAENAAAEELLVLSEEEWAAAGAAPAGPERDRFALVGDAALDLLVALVAHRRGLGTKASNDLRCTLLSNVALGSGPGRAAATGVEAVVGRAVLTERGPQLEAALLADVRRAAPSLAKAIEAESTFETASATEGSAAA